MKSSQLSSLSLYISHELPKNYDETLVIYSEGSYYPKNLLNEQNEFIYIVIKNNKDIKRTLTSVYFSFMAYVNEKSDEELKSEFFPFNLDIHFNKHNVFGRKIEANSFLVFATLKEHVIKNIVYKYPLEHVYLQAKCITLDETITCSNAVKIDLNYPTNPLQDIELIDYYPVLQMEQDLFLHEVERIKHNYASLYDYACLHKELGIQLIKEDDTRYYLCREYAPSASRLFLSLNTNGFGDFKEYEFSREEHGFWSLKLPHTALFHGIYYELHVYAKDNTKHVRIPALASWVEQNILDANQWCARFWNPEFKYTFKNPKISHKYPIIYEAHVGMAQDKSNYKSIHSYGTYNYFKEVLLPRIKKMGFNTIQLMGIAEHPLYKSFGYQVSSFFAVCHRFGTVNEFKELVDKAHELGICVLLDIVHSHSTSNTREGMAKYDTSSYFFCDKLSQWGTALFDYENEMTRRFLLSNLRYWQEEFNIDGFRFDAVGTMMYNDEGFQDDFSHVNACFYGKDGSNRRNSKGIMYLQLANTLIHDINKEAITIAEEFSGAPGLTSPANQAGLGFDYRFAMGIPDYFAKYITKECTSVTKMWTECSYHRLYDKNLSYVECHDQSINGEDAMIWRLIGDDMYTKMSWNTQNPNIWHGVSLIKLMKLMTFSLADKGYMNFMGNEFGHPEWIDVDVNPYRQWTLTDNALSYYNSLQKYNDDMFKLLEHDIYKHMPRLRLLHDEKGLIVFERGSLLFFFNFNTSDSLTICTHVTTGKYIELFSSDESEYAGMSNITAKHAKSLYTKADTGDFEQEIDVQLPALTAFVLKKVD